MSRDLILFAGELTAKESKRFWAKVDKQEEVPESDSCWLWTSALSNGYGVFTFRRQSVKAHRLSWYIVKGKNPDSETIDHLCRNKKCVNPKHLEPVTFAENTRRENLQRELPEVCVNDHPYTEENTYYHPSGGRRCYECVREYDRKRAKERYKKEKELATHSSEMKDFASEPKLDDKKVRRIRNLYSEGLSQRRLAYMFEVSQPMIGYITRNESWEDPKWDPKTKDFNS